MSDGMSQLAAQVDFEMGRRDFKYFFEEICGKYDEKMPWILTKFHEEWFNLSENNSKTCIIASRDHGKSVFLQGVFAMEDGIQSRHRSSVLFTQPTSVNRTHGQNE